MLSIQFNKFGSPEVLNIVETELPKINQDEVLIKVFGAGVNPVDAKTRQGLGFVAQSINLPWTLGYDVSGEIVESNSNEFKKGDLVFGMVGFPLKAGCYAEFVTAKDTEIIKIPNNIDAISAGGVPLAALTAYQGIIKIAELKKNDRILIHAGAGGVGHFAVQFVKNIGAYVITTASNENKDFLYSIGADEVIDYNEEDFRELSGIDIVYDLMGFDIGVDSINILKDGGKIITVPTITAEKVCNAAKEKDIFATGMKVVADKNDLNTIADLIENKKIKIKVDKFYNLKNASQAHKQIESGKTRGKIILKTNN